MYHDSNDITAVLLRPTERITAFTPLMRPKLLQSQCASYRYYNMSDILVGPRALQRTWIPIVDASHLERFKLTSQNKEPIQIVFRSFPESWLRLPDIHLGELM